MTLFFLPFYRITRWLSGSPKNALNTLITDTELPCQHTHLWKWTQTKSADESHVIRLKALQRKSVGIIFSKKKKTFPRWRMTCLAWLLFLESESIHQQTDIKDKVYLTCSSQVDPSECELFILTWPLKSHIQDIRHWGIMGYQQYQTVYRVVSDFRNSE